MPEYREAEDVFRDADQQTEAARAILARAQPAGEGDPAWLYLTETRKLPEATVRGAVSSLRYLRPPIEGRPPQDHAVVSLLRDQAGEVSGIQLTFIDIKGRASATEPKRQTYSLRPNGCRDGLFHAGGGTGERCYLVEGYAEKALAVAALGIGPVYGAGSRTVLGRALPPEDDVVLVTDRRPDDKVADFKTGRTAADGHDRDYKRACDLLVIGRKAVWVTPDPPCACCKDADDVLAAHGADDLGNWIEQAQPASLSLDGEARRLALIEDRLERDKETSATARRLKVQVRVLREAVARHLKGGADREAEDDTATGSGLNFEELEPSAERQDGEQLLEDIDAAIARHVFIDRYDRVKAVLWSVHGHRRFHRNIAVLPRVVVSAAGEDSGKSTLAEVLQHLGDVMAYSTDPSPAAVFRSIEAHFCGWIFDEVDAWYGHLDEMRRIINAGFDERAKIHRVEDVGHGDKRQLETRAFSPYAPIAIIGVGVDKLLRRTTLSRSLVIRMRPARPGEIRAEVSGDRAAVAELRAASGRIKRWVADNEMAMNVAKPDLPVGLHNRLKLVWRPMLVIADRAGGNWPRLAREAMEIDRGRAADPGLSEQMLIDVRDIMVSSGVVVMHTADLIAHLREMELRTWSVYGKARVAVRDIDIAKLLDPFEVKPEQIKLLGHNRNGYRLAHIEAAVHRYILYSKDRGAGDVYQSTGGTRPNSGNESSVDPPDSTSGLPFEVSTSEDSFGEKVDPTRNRGSTGFHERNQCGRQVDPLEGGSSEYNIHGGPDASVGSHGPPADDPTAECVEQDGGAEKQACETRSRKRQSSRKASEPKPEQPTPAEEAPPIPEAPSPEPPIPEPPIKGANGKPKPELLP